MSSSLPSKRWCIIGWYMDGLPSNVTEDSGVKILVASMYS